MDYGTGAIMAVPAHDGGEGDFARKSALPVRTVIDEDGVVVDSGEFTGRPAEEAKAAIVEWLHHEGRGAQAVSFRLRDWSFSRQRYWGCPIPIMYCDACGVVPVPDEDLPVLLPDVDDYLPKGKAPLASNEEWLHTDCPRCGGPGARAAATRGTLVDSRREVIRHAHPPKSPPPPRPSR